jgi:glycosyltransferase involved in cell wall biosynthesis
MTAATFTILITTKNRAVELAYTLSQIKHLLRRNDVSCIVCDDGSTDDTVAFLKLYYPAIQLIQNEKSQGLIYSRNRLMGLVTTDYAISIDDDLHFLTENPLESIVAFFDVHPNVGILGFRIFWGIEAPGSTFTSELPERMKGFAGGAHAFRMQAWGAIPNYPAWFIFYGEEDFAAYQLFKVHWEIHYLPTVLVHHRVDVRSRKNNKDYVIRTRRALRAGWYLFFLFYPLQIIPRKMAYSIWKQLQLKVFKGDWKALQAILLALLDLIWNMPRIVKNANRLTTKEYEAYLRIADTKIYWEQDKKEFT